jgi:hypothetical protein
MAGMGEIALLQSRSLLAYDSLHEKRDGDERDNHKCDTSHKHVADMKPRGPRSHAYFIVVSDDRTFVLIHRKLLS